MNSSKILSISNIGKKKTYNICMKSDQHNYLLSDRSGNNVVSKNSTAYAEITYQSAYLKTYYPEEFICAILTSMANKDDKKLAKSIENFKKEYKKLEILNPDVNESKNHYTPTSKKMIIRTPFIGLKSLGLKASEHLVSLQPFISIEHFLNSVDKSIINNRIFKILLDEGAFDRFGDRRKIENEKNKHTQMNGIYKSGGKKADNKIQDLF